MKHILVSTSYSSGGDDKLPDVLNLILLKDFENGIRLYFNPEAIY